MTHGFDLSDPLVCEGIIGDGCGGGRIFFIQGQMLYAHDPVSGDNIELLQTCGTPRRLTKKGCVLTLACEDTVIEFDLSSMTQSVKKF